MKRLLSYEDQIRLLEQYMTEVIEERKSKGFVDDINIEVKRACFLSLRLALPSYRLAQWDRLRAMFETDMTRRNLRVISKDFNLFIVVEDPTLKLIGRFLASQEVSKFVPMKYLDIILRYLYKEFDKVSKHYDKAIVAIQSGDEESKSLMEARKYCKKHSYNIYSDISSNFKAETFLLLLNGVSEAYLLSHPYKEKIREVLDLFVSRKVAYYNNLKYEIFKSSLTPQNMSSLQADSKKELRERYGANYERGVHIGQDKFLVLKLSNQGIKKAEEILELAVNDLKKLLSDESNKVSDPTQDNRAVFFIEQFLVGNQKSVHDIDSRPDHGRSKGTIGYDISEDNSDLISKLKSEFKKAS